MIVSTLFGWANKKCLCQHFFGIELDRKCLCQHKIKNSTLDMLWCFKTVNNKACMCWVRLSKTRHVCVELDKLISSVEMVKIWQNKTIIYFYQFRLYMVITVNILASSKCTWILMHMHCPITDTSEFFSWHSDSAL